MVVIRIVNIALIVTGNKTYSKGMLLNDFSLIVIDFTLYFSSALGPRWGNFLTRPTTLDAVRGSPELDLILFWSDGVTYALY